MTALIQELLINKSARSQRLLNQQLSTFAGSPWNS